MILKLQNCRTFLGGNGEIGYEVDMLSCPRFEATSLCILPGVNGVNLLNKEGQ